VITAEGLKQCTRTTQYGRGLNYVASSASSPRVRRRAPGRRAHNGQGRSGGRRTGGAAGRSRRGRSPREHLGEQPKLRRAKGPSAEHRLGCSATCPGWRPVTEGSSPRRGHAGRASRSRPGCPWPTPGSCVEHAPRSRRLDRSASTIVEPVAPRPKAATLAIRPNCRCAADLSACRARAVASVRAQTICAIFRCEVPPCSLT
jgi:hypothetical protein